MVEKDYETKLSSNSSSGIKGLIRRYLDWTSEPEEPTDTEKIRIIPVLTFNRQLQYELKIGKSRMYAVGSIQKLRSNFQLHLTQKYGKELEFRHTYDALDEKSRQLLEFTFFSQRYAQDYNFSDRFVFLKGIALDRFFEIIGEETISFEGKDCLVRFADPKVTFAVEPANNNRFRLDADRSLKLLGIGGQHACFFEPQTRNPLSDLSTFYKNSPRAVFLPVPKRRDVYFRRGYTGVLYSGHQADAGACNL